VQARQERRFIPLPGLDCILAKPSQTSKTGRSSRKLSCMFCPKKPCRRSLTAIPRSEPSVQMRKRRRSRLQEPFMRQSWYIIGRRGNSPNAARALAHFNTAIACGLLRYKSSAQKKPRRMTGAAYRVVISRPRHLKRHDGERLAGPCKQCLPEQVSLVPELECIPVACCRSLRQRCRLIRPIRCG
jgi:hypothetical protein